MTHRDAQHMARAVEGMENRTTLSKYAEAKADTCQKMTKYAE